MTNETQEQVDNDPLMKSWRKYENPSLKGVEFTKLSKKPTRSEEVLMVPDAVKFASKQGNGAILASAYECASAHDFHAADAAAGRQVINDSRATRTAAYYFKVGNKFYAAIDDTVNPEQNVVIARAHERFTYKDYKGIQQQDIRPHYYRGEFLLPISDSLVKGALLRAEKTGRIVEANAESWIHLEMKAVNGKSEFGQNDWIKAIFLDFAEPYAQKLNQRTHGFAESYTRNRDRIVEKLTQLFNEYRGFGGPVYVPYVPYVEERKIIVEGCFPYGCDTGVVQHLKPDELKAVGVDGNFVEVRPVILNSSPPIDYTVDAQTRFSGGGRAFAVRHAREFSIGNEGKVVKLDEKVSAYIRKVCA